MTLVTPNPSNPYQAAFPIQKDAVWGGMSLRHWYAGLAMQGLLMKHNNFMSQNEIIINSVKYADALIAELAKEP